MTLRNAVSGGVDPVPLTPDVGIYFSVESEVNLAGRQCRRMQLADDFEFFKTGVSDV